MPLANPHPTLTTATQRRPAGVRGLPRPGAAGHSSNTLQTLSATPGLTVG